MHLSGWRCFPLLFALLLACTEGTAPLSPLSGEYVLLSVAGEPLPVTIVQREGYETTVFWSILRLDAEGNAALVEHIRSTSPDRPAIERTSTSTYTYRVIGDSIAFQYQCDDIAVCVAPPGGKLDGSTLTLFYEGPPARPPSLYRRSSLD